MRASADYPFGVIGRRVGSYRIEKVLGEGAMGTVYAVRHIRLPNTVAALKVLKASPGRHDVAQRFMQEAIVAAAIGSHRVARPLDLGKLDHAPYILMELVEGRTLASRLAAGPLQLKQLVTIAYRIADTLATAHALGIVHRDIKPSNVMLVGADESQVKILDFGIARAAGLLKLAQTRRAEIVGSPGYLSPEAATGSDVDARTDVFSLGVLIFKMATGELPFPASLEPSAIGKLLTECAPTLSSKSSSGLLPMDLDALVTEMLAKARDDRPTMVDVRNRLARLAEPHCAEPLSIIESSHMPAAVDIEELPATITHVEGEELKRIRKRADRFVRQSTRRLAIAGLLSVAALAAIAVIVGLNASRDPSPPDAGRASATAADRDLAAEAEAARLMREGLAAYGQKQYELAQRDFETSYTLYPNAKTVLNLGTVYVTMGNRTRAIMLYKRYLQSTGVDDSHRPAVVRKLEELEHAQ